MATNPEPDRSRIDWRGFVLTRDAAGVLLLLAAFVIVWHRSGPVSVPANVSGSPAIPSEPTVVQPVGPEPGQRPPSIYDSAPLMAAVDPLPAPPQAPPAPERVPTAQTPPAPKTPRPQPEPRRTPVTNTSPARVPAAETYLHVFDDVKLVTADGRKAREQDARLTLGPDALQLEATKTGQQIGAMRYAAIEHATASFGSQPQWHQSTGAPPDDFRVARGLLRRRRHWLVLQGRDAYLIIRLDGRDWRDLLAALEVRGRITISTVEQQP